jgi:hypothetical protein
VAMRRVLIFCLAAAAASAAGPSVVTQPGNIEVPAGCPATLLVTATGDAPLAYQWWLGGEAVAAGTVSRYTFTTTEITADPASYWVVVTNISGSVTSSAATISVTEAADCPKQGLPNVRVGGCKVSLIIKAERFLPLQSANELWSYVVSLQSNELAAAFQPLSEMTHTNDYTYDQARNNSYSSTFIWSGLRGVRSVVQGYYSSNAAAFWSSSWANQGGTWWPVGYTFSNGVFQSRCVAIAPRFVFSYGHAPAPQWGNPQSTYYEYVDWNDEVDPTNGFQYSNCVFAANAPHKSWFFPTNAFVYYRFIGTNNQCYFRRSLARYFYWSGNTYPQHYGWPERTVDWSLEGNFGVNLLEEDLPPEVELVSFWPTNISDYCTSGRLSFPLPMVGTCQHQWYNVEQQSVEDYWPIGTLPELMFDCIVSGKLPASGDSGSPHFNVIGGQAVWCGTADHVSAAMSAPRYELLSGAMMHMWTNVAGEPAETCPKPLVVDLSAYEKLR